MSRSVRIKLLIFGLTLLAIILIPFFLFGDELETWIESVLKEAGRRPWISALTIMLVLATDVLLPIPSSMLSTAAGAVLGFWAGAFCSVIGMTASCIIGYGLGISAARGAVARWMNENEMQEMEAQTVKFGDWMLVVFRAVPVWAEVTTILAGMSKMKLRRFLVLTTSANVGISIVYAAAGAVAQSFDNLWLVLAASIGVPVLAMQLLKERSES
ncbi:MAG: VTT domain-containing protein [Planctomycetota bacterium]|nr:VTT domain-containing protein [Planctomycetota bacterium]MDP7249832.1 VTT domain-containing protein [Planctomycetota bacterium]